MTTAIHIPTTSEKKEALDKLIHWIEFYRNGNIRSWAKYKFGYSHDGVTVTPENANHFDSFELKILMQFCDANDFSGGIFVEIGGAKAPSFEVNICKS